VVRLEEGRQPARGELVEVQVGASSSLVELERVGDAGRFVDAVGEHHGVVEREVRALSQLRAGGVGGVAHEHDAAPREAPHHHVAVARQQQLIEVRDLRQYGLRVAGAIQHRGLEGVQAASSQRVVRVRAQAVEEAELGSIFDAFARRAQSRGQQTDHHARAAHDLPQHALVLAFGVFGHEPQGAPRVVRVALHERRGA